MTGLKLHLICHFLPFSLWIPCSKHSTFPSQTCTRQSLSELRFYAAWHCSSNVLASFIMLICGPHPKEFRFKSLEWSLRLCFFHKHPAWFWDEVKKYHPRNTPFFLCLVAMFSCLVDTSAFCQTQLKGLLCFPAFIGQRWSPVSVLPWYFS